MAVTTNSFKAWVLASRPKTLGAISCPILIGNALAYHEDQFSWLYFVVVLINGVLLQILANVVNDYGDFIKGSDTEDRLGPPRAMQMGWITKNAMLAGICLLLILSIICGLYLVYEAGWVIVVLGLIALMLCFAYTLGPVPLAYFGFAEVVIFAVFGPMIVLGSYFVQTKSMSATAWCMSISSGFLASALLLTNNLRDLVQDRRNHKRTTAVRFGEAWTRIIILAMLMVSIAGPFFLVLFFNFPSTVVLASLALFMPMKYLPMLMRDPISERFNLLLAAIGKALYWFGMLFCVGLFYGST